MVVAGGMRGAAGVRKLTRQVLGRLPSAQVGRRATDAGLDEAVVQGALELALRLGEAMLALGASAADVTAAIHRTARAFGLLGCQADVTFTSITISYDRGPGTFPITLMRVARISGLDYGRLGRVMQLSRDIGAERIPIDEALGRLKVHHLALDEIVEAPHAYRRWVVTLFFAVLAAAVAVLLGGGPAVAVVAGATTAVIDRAIWALDRWGLPPFFLQGIGAAIATLVAVGLYVLVPRLPVGFVDLPPSLVVASGIVVLLAGTSLVGAAEDAISGFPVTAGGRTFEVVVLTLGIVVGVGGVLDVARRAGVELVMTDNQQANGSFVVQVLASVVISGAWSMAQYARPRAAAAAAGAGGAAWIVYFVIREIGVGPAVASAVAALLIGFLAETLGPRIHVPPIVISVSGIVPLLPGMAIYRALFQLVNEPTSALGPGAANMLGAALIGLSLAAGVTLGEFLGAPLRRGTRQRPHVPGVFLRRAHRPHRAADAEAAAESAAEDAAEEAAGLAVDAAALSPAEPAALVRAAPEAAALAEVGHRDGPSQTAAGQ
ncbi:threonine/serine ThrE exporter family protein [Pengzhenrongella frigida]|uniref:Threonine/serine exporter family protein n=1 Tax=Pengzhenrongella frigida TaxID=1259133 RepID=A0A4Q5N773_9MICO|nr:threonine/serine exporter family protein [Cellulomonas sp. HLT2-17]RYV52947.1 threonine/serine exporter family protein [Cellulomonas sp. HLT2-17]